MTLLDLLSDFCFISYAAVLVTSCYGFMLFLGWFIFTKHASELYIYIMLLLLAISLYYSLNITARSIYVIGENGEYKNLLDSFLWSLRSVPVFILLLMIDFRMTRRAYTSIKLSRKKGISTVINTSFVTLYTELGVVCDEISISLKKAGIEYDNKKFASAIAKAAELYIGTKKIDVAIKVFCDELNLELEKRV